MLEIVRNYWQLVKETIPLDLLITGLATYLAVIVTLEKGIIVKVLRVIFNVLGIVSIVLVLIFIFRYYR
jgi:hypothetical protein